MVDIMINDSGGLWCVSGYDFWFVGCCLFMLLMGLEFGCVWVIVYDVFFGRYDYCFWYWMLLWLLIDWVLWVLW